MQRNPGQDPGRETASAVSDTRLELIRISFLPNDDPEVTKTSNKYWADFVGRLPEPRSGARWILKDYATRLDNLLTCLSRGK